MLLLAMKAMCIPLKSFLLAWLLIAAAATGASSQTDTDKITPQETREAKAFAKRFEKRLLQTKDIKPLIKEFFVKDFYQRLARDKYIWSIFLKREQFRAKSQAQLGRFYVAEINWIYLSLLYEGSKPETKNGDILTDLPADVRALFAKDSQTSKAMFEDGTSDAEKPAGYFDKALYLLEKTVPMLRRHAIRINAGYTAVWRKNMADAAKSMDYFEPVATGCEYYCGEMPAGTRVIHVMIGPRFLSTLIKEGSGFKIVSANFLFD